MVSIMTKIAGQTFTPNSSNITSGNTIPSGAAGTGPGATMMRIYNTSANTSITISVANAGVNTGTITLLPNNVEYVQKYVHDLVYCSNTTSGTVLITPVALTW